MPTILFLIRHGITAMNKDHIMQGSIDEPLDAEGLSQSEKLAVAMSQNEIDYIYHSGMKRAVQTAEMLAGTHPSAVLIRDRRLREIDSGELEGLTYDQCAEHSPEQMILLKSKPWQYASPGGENCQDVFARAVEAVQDILEKHKDKSVAIITHGFLLSTLIPWFDGLEPESMEHDIYENCSITEVHYDDESGFEVIRKNDHEHIGSNV